MKVVVFGGTAHSTPALWSYLVNEARLENLQMILLGRDQYRIAAVDRACRLIGNPNGSHLSAQLSCDETDPSVLNGADLVLIQIRNGGYAARNFDETFPLRYGISGDEGLGPGGLCCGLRNWKAIQPVLQKISRYAPRARVLMLSSPVGLLVRASRKMFPDLHVAGICELPWTTLLDTCRTACVAPADVQFDYFGVNHLGWLYGITKNGGDVSNAVPLKYLRLHHEQQQVVAEQRSAPRSRGAELDEVSRTAFRTYSEGNRAEVQRTLERRGTPWYRHAVGPLIAALSGRQVPTAFFLSVPNDGFDSSYRDDDVLEYAHAITVGDLQRRPRSRPVSQQMLELISRFVEYERLGTHAVLSADIAAVEQSLRAHPWVQRSARVGEMAQEIVNHVQSC